MHSPKHVGVVTIGVAFTMRTVSAFWMGDSRHPSTDTHSHASDLLTLCATKVCYRVSHALALHSHASDRVQ